MPLTIDNLAAPLPNISQALQPVVLPCSAWDQLNASIMQYPVAAAGVLGLAFWLLWSRR